MAIGAHDNPELSGSPPRGRLAAGSSNCCNSHCPGPIPERELTRQEISDTISQFNSLVPRLQAVVGRLEGGQ
jgi:hypothetical protein